MKTRQGFVSNSSSSSFVVIGANIKQKELIEMGWWSEDDGETEDIPEGYVVYYTEDSKGYLVGKSLCDEEDWGLCSAELDNEEVVKTFKEVTKTLKRPVKLMMGTRPT